MDEHDALADGMKQKLESFDVSLTNLETTLKPFITIPSNDINDKIDDPLLKARLDLMVAYSINSLFWAYLSTQGINAKQHPIRNELKRIQEYMAKVKLAEEKKKRARVDTHAAKRFLRNALWEAPAAGPAAGCSTNNDDVEEEEGAEPERKRLKQSHNKTDEEHGGQKRSKKKKSKKDKKKKKDEEQDG